MDTTDLTESPLTPQLSPKACSFQQIVPKRVLLEATVGVQGLGTKLLGLDPPHPHLSEKEILNPNVSSVEFLKALGSQAGVSVWQHTLVG